MTVKWENNWRMTVKCKNKLNSNICLSQWQFTSQDYNPPEIQKKSYIRDHIIKFEHLTFSYVFSITYEFFTITMNNGNFVKTTKT